ncbi:MAG: Gfo/Idh/MocA family oxidoreductase [Clostridia bacterium]|nr:Gfo/Idh/MocA family oxidoreductase [Clostridia bacterium]
MEKTCIIGCGAIFARHSEAVEALKEKTVLAAVCDIKKEKAIAAAEKFGCKAYFDYVKMLDEVKPTVVHVCTPHYLHFEMAAECLKRNINVVLEKPSAETYEKALKLCEIAKNSSAKVCVCFQNRYNKTSQALKTKISSGKYGKIYGARAFVTWSRDDAYYAESGWRGKMATEGGGVLINQSIHTLDLMQWVMGDVVKVEGTAVNHRFKHINDVEDTAEIALDFANGSRGIFFATVGYVKDSPIFLEIITEKAVFTLCDSLKINYADGSVETVENDRVATGEKAYWGDSHTLLISDFYSKIHDPEAFWVSPEEGAKCMRILNEVNRL